METIFYDFKNKNISAGELAKNFECCVPLEDFKNFIEERGGDDKFLIDLLISLWDDYVLSDFKIKIGNKDVILEMTMEETDKKFDCLNELTSAVSGTGLVRFFKLSAKLCSKYKNIYVEGELIDTKKYFSDLFDKVPEKYVDFKSCVINGEKGIRLEFKSKVESKCVDLICVVEDIDLGKNNYFSHFLSLLPIKDSDSENKYFLDFLASSLLKMYFAYSDAKGVSEQIKSSSRGWFDISELYYSKVFRTVLFHQIKKRGIVKNTYCRKDRMILDLMELLRKIYGDQDLSSLFYRNNDNDFLKCIRDIEEPGEKEKVEDANKLRGGIIFRLLFLLSNEASCNKYRLNIINWFFESCDEQLFKRVCDEFDGSSAKSFCFKNFEDEYVSARGFFYLEAIGAFIMATAMPVMCFFNHVDDKNFKKFFCSDKGFITFLKFIIPCWWHEINRPDKESVLGKLFSYDPKFVAIFLLVGANLESSSAESLWEAAENKDYNIVYKYFNRLKNKGPLHSSALKKYISSIKPNSEERKMLIEYISEAFESQGDKDKNKSKEDKEEEEKEIRDNAKNMVIDFLVDVNKQCFADLTKFRENSVLNVIKTKNPDLSIPKPLVPKLLDNINKYKDKCTII